MNIYITLLNNKVPLPPLQEALKNKENYQNHIYESIFDIHCWNKIQPEGVDTSHVILGLRKNKT